MANKVETIFTGDDSDLQKSFKDVGAGAKNMAADVGRASKDMSGSSDLAQSKVAEGIDASERRFRGMGDAINGTGDIMEGFRTGNVALLAMGMADMAGAMTDFLIPALNTVRTAIMSKVVPAFSFIMAHPLILAIVGAGLIIGGLILLEKKFGIVSDAVRALGDAFTAIKPVIFAVLNSLGTAVEFFFNDVLLGGLRGTRNLLAKIPGAGGFIPEIPRLSIPKLRHSGGTIMGPELALLQAGERVVPAGGSGAGTGGTTIVVQIGDREIGRVVADALRQNRLIGVTA